MKDEKEMLRCDECYSKIIKDEIRSEYYCSNCGLIRSPNHPMQFGLSGLISYMIHEGLNDHIDDIQLIHRIEGLASARLQVSKL